MNEGTVWCGIDPGTRNVGVAFLTRDHLGVWSPWIIESLSFKTEQSLDERLAIIHRAINPKPDDLPEGTMWIQYVVEEQEQARNAAHALGDTNFRADRVERVMGMIWTVAHTNAYSAARLTEVTPAEIRKSLGFRSGATKQQIAAIVKKLVPKLEKMPRPLTNHATDAVAIAIAGERIVKVRARLAETAEERMHRAVREGRL